jgi:hypothetical protein
MKLQRKTDDVCGTIKAVVSMADNNHAKQTHHIQAQLLAHLQKT